MGAEQSQQPQPPPQPASSTSKNQPRGSQFAPSIGARGKSIVNTADEVNKEANKKFSQELLNVHNDIRARHKAPPLKLNLKLSLVAQEWADRISKLGTPDPRPPSFQFGQNLYYSRWATDAESVCRSWYKEGNKYSYDKEPNPPPVTNVNFTQMVWKSTTEMGVGIASSWANVTYVVVNYKPKGNVKGEYKKNVLAPAPLEKGDEAGGKKRVSVEEQAAAPKAPPVEPKTGNAANLGVFQRKMLQLINEFRDTHSVKPLKIVGALHTLAQKHAELMATTRKVEPFKGKISPPVGTSFYSSKWYTEPKDACLFWYAENKRYKYDEPTIVSLSTGITTNKDMVWANTKDVGFGRAEAAGYVYITAFYRPVGNVLGEFKKNVKPFRVGTNMTATNNDFQGMARKSKAVSVVLPAV